MGITFDEEWEYYTASEDVQEIIDASEAKDRLKKLPRLPANELLDDKRMTVYKVRSRNNGRMTVEGMRYIKEAYLSGKCYKTMQKTTGLSRSTVREALIIMGIPLTRKPRVSSRVKSKRRRFRYYYSNTSLTMWEISIKLGSHYVTLNKWRKEMKLPARRKTVSCNTSGQ
jgi:hypothetical protein